MSVVYKTVSLAVIIFYDSYFENVITYFWIYFSSKFQNPITCATIWFVSWSITSPPKIVGHVPHLVLRFRRQWLYYQRCKRFSNLSVGISLFQQQCLHYINNWFWILMKYTCTLIFEKILLLILNRDIQCVSLHNTC